MDKNQLIDTRESFLSELNRSDSGQKSSLPFIVQEISDTPIAKEGETFQVLVIGGSVCKKALVKKTDEIVEIIKKESKQQPVFHTDLDFFTFVSGEIDPSVRVVALNFAYPLKPVFESGKVDGILVSGSKENRFEGLVGKKVGSSIEEYIKKTQKRNIIISPANDTVCLLLSGLTKYSYENLACGIVGTGVNFAFFLDQNHVVNLESANFDKFPQSKEGKEIDAESKEKGAALFEKETSGGYLFKHFNRIIQKEKINFKRLSSTLELKDVALSMTPVVSEIAKKLIERSAELVSCQIAGITLFKKWDMVFIMDGSFFWDNVLYKAYAEHTVDGLVPEYLVEMVRIEDCTIFGGAQLVT